MQGEDTWNRLEPSLEPEAKLNSAQQSLTVREHRHNKEGLIFISEVGSQGRCSKLDSYTKIHPGGISEHRFTDLPDTSHSSGFRKAEISHGTIWC